MAEYIVGAFVCGGLFAIFILVLIGAGIAFRNTLSSLAATVTLSTAGGSAFICWVLLIVFLILHLKKGKGGSSKIVHVPDPTPIPQVIGGRDEHGCVLPYKWNSEAGRCLRFDECLPGSDQLYNRATGECESVPNPTQIPQTIGGPDEHGCIPGAGQSFDVATRKCKALDGSLLNPKIVPAPPLDGSLLEPIQPKQPDLGYVQNRYFCVHPWDAKAVNPAWNNQAAACQFKSGTPSAEFPIQPVQDIMGHPQFDQST